MRALVLALALGAAIPARADDASERLVLLAPDWMPTIAIGYQSAWTRRSYGSDARAHRLQGVSGSLLVPIVASGTSRSRTRLGLGLGVGVDYAFADSSFRDTRRESSLHLYGELAMILRVVKRGVGFVGTLSWLPGRHELASDEAIYATGLMSSEHAITLARGRLSLGAVVRHVQITVFTGVGHWPDMGTYEKVRQIELGARIGSGW